MGCGGVCFAASDSSLCRSLATCSLWLTCLCLQVPLTSPDCLEVVGVAFIGALETQSNSAISMYEQQAKSIHRYQTSLTANLWVLEVKFHIAPFTERQAGKQKTFCYFITKISPYILCFTHWAVGWLADVLLPSGIWLTSGDEFASRRIFSSALFSLSSAALFSFTASNNSRFLRFSSTSSSRSLISLSFLNWSSFCEWT